MECTIELHNTWLKLADAAERLKVNRRRLRLDVMGNLVEGPEDRNGQIPKAIFDLTKFTERCWEWQGPRNRKGYGMISLRRTFDYCQDMPVHRLVYMLTVGAIPDRMLICHSCDNRPCINPHHLFLGDDLINCHDKIKKGRLNPEKGTDRYNCKLDEEKVKEIRSYCVGVRGQMMDMARKFSVSVSVIANIVHRTRWKHVL